MFASFSELKKALAELESDGALQASIRDALNILSNALKNGNKILIAGNGGSAAEADHFAAEIVGRYTRERKGYPALSLSASAASVTAIANDYGYKEVFARQVEALGVSGDVFFGLSTSGNSDNLVRAVEVGKSKGLHTVCLLGKGGGKLAALADTALVVPGQTTARIQELHLLIIHTLCDELEKNF